MNSRRRANREKSTPGRGKEDRVRSKKTKRELMVRALTGLNGASLHFVMDRR